MTSKVFNITSLNEIISDKYEYTLITNLYVGIQIFILILWVPPFFFYSFIIHYDCLPN